MTTRKKLNTLDAAEYLGIQPNTLEVWRSQGKGPRYAKLGRRVMYDLNDLENWFSAQCVETIDTTTKPMRPRLGGQ
ncbi:MAG: helix-turn-helix domain-containing protein [Acidaminococcaceae bacterium]|nr:helix-turn-helix domain-containing protein [Acidaminococcaceae bacterium]